MPLALATIDPDQLAVLVPSAFADHAYAQVSPRYCFIPTADIIRSLASLGWLPVYGSQARVRHQSRHGYQKHMIRFAHRESLSDRSDRAEIVLINSHDRSSAYQLHAGFFRVACENGLIVSDGLFSRISISHVNQSVDDVLAASVTVSEAVPRLVAEVDSWKNRRLTDAEQNEFARQALALRWPSNAPILPDTLNESRRYDDDGPDLWTTFNRIQENLIRGRLRDSRVVNPRTLLPYPQTRPIKSVSESVRLNKSLWTLAQNFARN